MKKFSVTFNYDLLLSKMKENRYSQESLAPAVKMSRTSLNQKLKSKSNFTQAEIIRISRKLGIENNEVGKYFFNASVRKTEQKEEVS